MATVKYFQSKDTNDKNNISVRNVIFSVIFSYFFVLFSIFLLSLAVVYGPLKISSSEKIVSFIYCFSCLLCGFIASVKLKKNGWVNGAVSSSVYFLVVLCSVLCVYRIGFDFGIIVKFFITVSLGIIGGVAGVNTKKRKKKY